jgi:phosphate acetyltransferase
VTSRRSARHCRRNARGLIEPILVGPLARLRAVAEQAGLDLAGVQIEDVPHSHAAAFRAVELVRLGKARR